MFIARINGITPTISSNEFDVAIISPHVSSRPYTSVFFDLRQFYLLPVNCGNHFDYQNFVVTNLSKYYPNPDSFARSTWNIIEQFLNLDLSDTDILMADKYSKSNPVLVTPYCIQYSYLLSIDFKVSSLL